MAEKVVLLEFVDQARAFVADIEQKGLNPSSYRVIGLEPAVRAFLKSKGIECLDTLPFFDNEAHARLLYESEKLTQSIECSLCLDLGNDLQESYQQEFSLFFLHLWMQMRKTIEVLERAHQTYPEAKFLICPQQGPEIGFLNSVGPRFCEQNHIPIERIPVLQENPTAASPNKHPEKGILHRIRTAENNFSDWFVTQCYYRTLRFYSRVTYILTPLQFVGLDTVMTGINARFPYVKFVALRSGQYRRRAELRAAITWMMNALFRHASGASLQTIPVDIPRDVRYEKERNILRQKVEKSVVAWAYANEDLFTYGGISCIAECLSEAKRFTIPRIVWLYEIAQIQSTILKELKPAMVISPFSWGLARPLGKLCSQNHIPAIVTPTKTLARHDNRLGNIGERQIGIEIITNEYAFVAVQTPQTQRYLEGMGYTGQMIFTGPLVWSKISSARREQERAKFFQASGAPGHIVVYAPSARRIPYFHVVQTMDEVLSSMVDIIEALAGKKGIYLILRLHPDHYISRRDIETLVQIPENVIINDSGRSSFADVLALADVLISNVSTTTEEALQNHIPVILYDKWQRYNHLNAPPVEGKVPSGVSPAYYVSSKQHLGSTIEWVLAAQAAHLRPPQELATQYVFEPGYEETFYGFVRQVLEGTGV